MRLKALRYFLHRTLNCVRPSAFAAAIAQPLGTRILWPSEIRKGIRIVDPFAETRAAFLSAVDEALELVQNNDPLRFARIRREIRTILNMPVSGAGAGYNRCHRTCTLDLHCFPIERDKKSAITFMACMLVHESTHGHLFSRKVLQKENNLPRIEELCWTQELRFAQKLNFDLAKWDPFVPPSKLPGPGERLRFGVEQAKRMWKS